MTSVYDACLYPFLTEPVNICGSLMWVRKCAVDIFVYALGSDVHGLIVSLVTLREV